jgi:hypothetical protein
MEGAGCLACLGVYQQASSSPAPKVQSHQVLLAHENSFW